MHSVIMEEEKHDRREDILTRKYMKEEEKHAVQTIPEKTVTKWMHILSIF